MYKKLEKCLKSIREKTDFKPEKAVILGSGLGDYAEKIKIEKIVKYTDIEDFPVSTVQGHKGQFVFGYADQRPHYDSSTKSADRTEYRRTRNQIPGYE